MNTQNSIILVTRGDGSFAPGAGNELNCASWSLVSRVTFIDWEDANDPHNPQNWSERTKWIIILWMSVVTFNQAMSSTIFAPGVPQAMEYFHSDNEAYQSLLITMYVIGLAIGPIFLAPLTELYGRSPITHWTNISFLSATVLCTFSTNVPMLLVARFIAGASTVSLGGGYVADLMSPEKRPRAMNVWSIGPVMAPVAGPVIGGYIALHTSWRWVFGLLAITGALVTILCFLFLPETFGPRILELKARKLRKSTGDSQLRTRNDTGQTTLQLVYLSMLRPLQMLSSCPILNIVSLILAVAYSYMYLMFTTFTDVFETNYGFDVGAAGLTYIGFGIGCILSQIGQDMFMKWFRRRKTAELALISPEYLLSPLIAAGPLVSIGLLWYGWSVRYRCHWIVPILGTTVVGVGIMPFFLCVQSYVVEAFTSYAASALAASSLVRSIFGLTIPLAGPALYSHLGMGWGNTILGLLVLPSIVGSLLVLKYGRWLREKSPFPTHSRETAIQSSQQSP